MSDSNGKNILYAVRQVRTLMVEVSKLLLEADAIMGAAGWGPRVGATALAGGAFSINSPKNWIPHRVFRFYKHEEHPKVVLSLAVILDEQGVDQKVAEPLVSGLLMEYETVNEIPEGNSLYNTAIWHLYVPERKDDGSIVAIVPREQWEAESTAKLMRSFAIPLVSVTSRERLEQSIVSKLLRLVESAPSSGEKGSATVQSQ
jgi:hypothetical protein